MIRSGEEYDKVVMHTGSWPGYKTIMFTIPELDLSIVVLSNNDCLGAVLLADEIMGELFRP
jgi:hypothetical protein